MAYTNSKPHVGEVRPSQLMFTYGVGALVDLPKLSVIVTGLEDWPANPEYARPVNESRLLEAVKFHLPSVERMLTPPAVTETGAPPDPLDPIMQIGVPVAAFPRWMVCPHCRILAPLSSGLFELDPDLYQPDRTCYRHTSCNVKRNPEVLPARFLVACENGHLDDFPWMEFVHRGQMCIAPVLHLSEHGPSGEARDLEVSCMTCKSQRRLSEAFGVENRKNMPQCRGRRPHLRDYEPEGCKLQMRTIILGASNTWFSASLSTIAIPVSVDAIMQMIDENWETLKLVPSVDIIQFMRLTGQLGRLSPYTNQRIFEAIEEHKTQLMGGGARRSKPDLKTPEWNVFVEHDPAKTSDDFRLRPVQVPPKYTNVLRQVVLVERLREVTAMVGFTRVDSGGELTDELDIPTKNAPLSRNPPGWVPAIEVRGEGIFIQFDEQKINAWVQREAVVLAADEFMDAHIRWRKSRGIEPPEDGFPGMRYVLLHSFSHALMRQLSLECGYSAASLRERIYARAPKDDQPGMAGILIYTSAPDSEGTLGGLVSLGETETLGMHIAQALESAQLCANDPLCAEHIAGSQGHSIHAAACHACLFSSETSCERGNRYLDRSTLVPTVERDELNFFGLL
jgi:hypothetical protein